MGENGGVGESGSAREADLRLHLRRMERCRDRIAKAWIADVILNSDLSEVEETPLSWASEELPQLISDILAALGRDEAAMDSAVQRAALLAEERGPETTPAQISREISYLHSSLLSTMRAELASFQPELFAEAIERLSAVFARIAAQAVDALARNSEPLDDSTGLLSRIHMQQRLEQMIAASKRYGSQFALLVLDVDGPGARDGFEAMGIVSQAVRGSIRLMDEAFYANGDVLWVIAPNQTAGSAVQMAHRLNRVLDRLERASGLRITVSAGVVACPEHGEEPDFLLRAADTAMWRARATGQPVTVGELQDR